MLSHLSARESVNGGEGGGSVLVIIRSVPLNYLCDVNICCPDDKRLLNKFLFERLSSRSKYAVLTVRHASAV